jgi:glucuronoarabinoxylan endo-1,4-beta-xylanase
MRIAGGVGGLLVVAAFCGCAPVPSEAREQTRRALLSGADAGDTGIARPADAERVDGRRSARCLLPAAAVSDAAASDAGAGDAGAGDAGASARAEVTVDPSVAFQTISGFGGINVPGWIADLTPEQVETAFGNGPGQIGMSILRVRVPYDPAAFELEVPTAAHAVALGARVIASPWTPPASLKSNADIIGGELLPEAYGAYADHLLSFRDYLQERGVPLHAISVQNEPDISVTYESCDWTPEQMVDWLLGQGERFGSTPLIAAESFNFNRRMTDPILLNPAAAAHVGIIGGHIYGNGLSDYPLARSSGKEVWMTEHYTESRNSANAWPLALNVGKEIHDIMAANFSAYIWWYIRRSYGPLTEDGLVSKRGYLMAQYAKFVRPGAVRIAATPATLGDVHVTAFDVPAAAASAEEGEQLSRLVVVAVNQGTEPRNIDIAVRDSCVDEFSRYATSESKSLSEDGAVALRDGRLSVTLDAQSVTTFVSR